MVINLLMDSRDLVIILVGGCATTLHNDCVQFLYLSLCAHQGSEALLGKSPGTLFLAVLQELQDATFIGGKSHDLPDQSTDKLDSWVKALEKVSTNVLGDGRTGTPKMHPSIKNALGCRTSFGQDTYSLTVGWLGSGWQWGDLMSVAITNDNS